MIFASLDLNRECLEEFLASLESIGKAKFDGVEVCLWGDMNDYADRVRDGLKRTELASNVHNDLMRAERGIEDCRQRLSSGKRFRKSIGAHNFITHPIKPYIPNLRMSKQLFNSFDGEMLVETVKEIRAPEIAFLGRPVVLDIGSITNNGEGSRLLGYKGVKWLHIHDIKDGKDHLPLGQGRLDLDSLIRSFPRMGCTIELGSIFRRWNELREDYIGSIDRLNNSIIYCDSYGKNVRLQHLLKLLKNRTLGRVFEVGCGDGYLLHNVRASDKKGYDIKPKAVFNDIDYSKQEIGHLADRGADLVICSEVIEHVQDDRGAIKTLRDAVNPQGLVFLSTINRNIAVDKSKVDRERGHYRRYGKELRGMMESQGFRTISFYPFRSQHYYAIGGHIEQYNLEEDIKQGDRNASGWVYFGAFGER